MGSIFDQPIREIVDFRIELKRGSREKDLARLGHRRGSTRKIRRRPRHVVRFAAPANDFYRTEMNRLSNRDSLTGSNPPT
jgi:hypothetical protein